MEAILLGQDKRSRINYSIIIQEEGTDKKYNLVVEDGTLRLQEISSTLPVDNDMVLIDGVTGKFQKLIIEDSVLKLKEV